MGIRTRLMLAKTIAVEDLQDLSLRVCKRFIWVKPDYIPKKFASYPHVALSYQHKKIEGFILYNKFENGRCCFLYFGPMFFLDRKAFMVSAFSVLEEYSKLYDEIYIACEIQNPELLIHLQSVMPEQFFPQGFDMTCSDKVQSVIKDYILHIPQMDHVAPGYIKTVGCASSIFRPSEKHKNILEWLARFDVHFEEGDALLGIIHLKQNDLVQIRRSIWEKFLTYPTHKTEYLNKLVDYLGEHHADQKRRHREPI